MPLSWKSNFALSINETEKMNNADVDDCVDRINHPTDKIDKVS